MLKITRLAKQGERERHSGAVTAESFSTKFSRTRLLALAVLLCASPAWSQDRTRTTGTLVPDREPTSMVHGGGTPGTNLLTEIVAPDAAMVAARAMMACVVSRNPRGIAAALNSDDQRSFLKRAASLQPVLGKCAGRGDMANATHVSFKFRPAQLYEIAAEAWLGRAELPALPVSTYTRGPSALDWLADDEAKLGMLRLATCLASTLPDRSMALVRSAPGTAEEAAATSSVISLVSRCLAKGVRLTTDRDGLRLALAAALYRRVSGLEAAQLRDSAHEKS